MKALQEILLATDYDDVDNGVDVFNEDRDHVYGFELNLQDGDH